MAMITDQANSERVEPSNPPSTLKTATLKTLFDISADAFKQQSDLDESVWRSLPFIAALFGFAISIIGTAAPRHQFSWAASNIFYFLAIFAFCVASFYVYLAVRVREFEYPAKTAETRDYAVKLTAWYAANNVHHARIDAKVVDDIRAFMIDQLASANKTNQIHLRKRLLARSFAINIMLVGFLFISVSEAIIFVTDRFPKTGAEANDSSSAAAAPSAQKASGAAKGHPR